MKYTAKDIKVGTKMTCIDNNGTSWWTNGKIYEVQKSRLSESGLCIIDDQGSERYLEGILARLNNENNDVKFEIVEEEKEMTKYVEVTKLIDWSSDPELLEVGKVYKVVDEYKDMVYIKGVSIYVNENEPDYYLSSDQFKYVEQNEEEKEMTKYAKITKYLGPHNIDKRLGLEIGKTYKIVEYKSPLTDNCYIYLNDEYPYYFISERQYELVEKEETPTFKTTIDLKSSVQAKIDSLTTEAEHLFKKRDRLEQQAINLSKKARKLNNLIETIKEFE
ncbi:hypothetical protein phiSHEF5_12 [Enterococcus phage phiSHEF5]|uniref:Tail length tape-measure protein n=1 Tax=Enterococcus phage phiSHEF5 TaxID=2030924 RepID=A0A249XUN2_9CAUD|nr:hypothetical protein FDI50_gp12 [Enterococcus phage phiSHEF5]ASZ75668.1 hypothetical protein phiSHEF5_12 [Enterococcus phage phiSHEF5]